MVNLFKTLAETANNFDKRKLNNFKMASNAIDIILKEASEENFSDLDVVKKMALFASILDLENQKSASDILDSVFITLTNLLNKSASVADYPGQSGNLWPSANDRDEKYDFQKHNKESLFQALSEEDKKIEEIGPHLETMKGEANSLLTRYSPDFPGVMMGRISDGVYQDSMTHKIYDFNNGWVSESGESYPGGSTANQTPSSMHYLSFPQVFESNNFRSRPR